MGRMIDVRALRDNPEPARASQRARGANPGLVDGEHQRDQHPGRPQEAHHRSLGAGLRLVIAFIGVLVFTWSHLGDSNAIYEDAKEKARHAQEERDRAQSTLDDINRQIEEAEK